MIPQHVDGAAAGTKFPAFRIGINSTYSGKFMQMLSDIICKMRGQCE